MSWRSARASLDVCPGLAVCGRLVWPGYANPNQTSTRKAIFRTRRLENLTDKLDLRHAVFGNPFLHRQGLSDVNLFRHRQSHFINAAPHNDAGACWGPILRIISTFLLRRSIWRRSKGSLSLGLARKGLHPSAFSFPQDKTPFPQGLPRGKSKCGAPACARSRPAERKGTDALPVNDSRSLEQSTGPRIPACGQ